MKRWRYAFFLTVCLALTPAFQNFAGAEDPSVAPSPAPIVPTVKLPPYLDFLQLKSDVAERNYATEATKDTLSEYVSTLQDSIAAGCMGTLRSQLEYSGFSDDERCRGLIKKTLALDGNNPFAFCTQNGIDSRECLETAATIKLGSFDVDSGSWILDDGTQSGILPPIDLKTALDQKTQHKQLADSAVTMKQLASQLKKKADSAVRKKYEELISASLQTACVDIRSLVIPLPGEKPVPTPTPAVSESSVFKHHPYPGSPSGKVVDPAPLPTTPAETTQNSTGPDPFSDLLDSMDGGRPAATPTPAPLHFDGTQHQHIRLIPAECLNLIKGVPPLLSDIPAVTCNRDGPVSPTCIRSRRAALRNSPHKSSQKIYGEGLSNF